MWLMCTQSRLETAVTQTLLPWSLLFIKSVGRVEGVNFPSEAAVKIQRSQSYLPETQNEGGKMKIQVCSILKPTFQNSTLQCHFETSQEAKQAPLKSKKSESA